MTAFYFKLEDSTFKYFKHYNESGISYSMSKRLSEKEAEWDNIHVKRIQQAAKLYTSFKIVSLQETYCILSHSKFVSVYSIEQ